MRLCNEHLHTAIGYRKFGCSASNPGDFVMALAKEEQATNGATMLAIVHNVLKIHGGLPRSSDSEPRLDLKKLPCSEIPFTLS